MQIGPYTAHEHQVRMLHESRQAIADLIQIGEKPRVLVVAPTGSGKTIYSSMVMNSMKPGKRVAFIVSGRQLVFQKSRTLSKCKIAHSLLMAQVGAEVDKRRDGDDWNVAEFSEYMLEDYWERIIISKDTLESRSHTLNSLGVSLVIVDEAHQSLSEKWIEMLEEAECPIIGQTATPIDGKGRGLPFYKKIVIGASYSDLIEKKLLVPCKVVIPFIVELKRRNGEKVKVSSSGEYNQVDLDEVYNEKTLIGDILETWKKHADNRPTLLYGASVAHALALKEAFCEAGIKTEHVDADTGYKERERIYTGFQNGTIQVLTNFGVLRVGADFPCAEVVQLAVSINSLSQFLQTVGRGLRTYHNEETGYTKDFCKVIDHGGNIVGADGYAKHGWPTDDRIWPETVDEVVKRVNSETKKVSDTPEKISVCVKCQFEKGNRKVCPNCGYEYQRSGVMLRTIDGEFKEITPKQIKKKSEKSEDQKLWMTCLAICANKGLPIRAAMAIFRQKSGKSVPKEVGPQPELHQLGMRVSAVYPGFNRKKKVKS